MIRIFYMWVYTYLHDHNTTKVDPARGTIDVGFLIGSVAAPTS